MEVSMDEKRNNPDSAETRNQDIAILLSDMWRGICRHIIPVILILNFFTMGGYAYARMHYMPRYQAFSTFSVSDERTNYSGDKYNKAVAKQIGSILPYLLNSSQMAELVKDDLDLETQPGIIETETVTDTNLITIKVTAGEPKLAYAILQSLIQNYPEVSQYLLGDVQLNQIDGNGVPRTPINSNNVTRNTVKGFLAGLALVLVWMFLYATSRKTVRNEEDVRKILNVPTMATIPQVRKKKRSSSRQNSLMIDDRYCSGPYVESIRTLRIRMIKAMAEHKYRTILVTSSVPNEGKTTIAANLALALAQRGLRVLLVDGDLRRCSLMETMGLKPAEKGFCDVLRGEIEPEDVIVPYKETSLELLPGGDPIDQPGDLLHERRIEAVIEQLRSHTEILIMDTPPSAVVTDASIYAKYMDCALYIVRQDYVKYDGVLDGVSVLHDSEIPLVGCVLNNTTAAGSGYRYGYGYGYGYASGYGYGYNSEYGDGRNQTRKETAEKQAQSEEADEKYLDEIRDANRPETELK